MTKRITDSIGDGESGDDVKTINTYGVTKGNGAADSKISQAGVGA